MNVEYLVTWMMVFLRSLGLLLQLPVLAGRPIPVTVRLGIGVCIATLIAGNIPPAELPPSLPELAVMVGREVLVGLALGFVSRLAFAAVEMAGRMMSSEIGLSATPGMGIPEPSTEPLAALLSSFAIVLFFLLGGHEALLAAFARSFQIAHPGRASLNPAAAEELIRLTSHVIELGLRIAAPFIAMNFLVTLAFSALGRAVPKMNVFVLSFSVRALAGLGLLSAAGALIARYLYVEFADAPIQMLQVLPTR
ncbi:MAG: type secretion system inner rane protein [Verrucomicrobia bacterium]|nr:type secretion system inner rane protein [Verrucomicrobiota bacterium]